MNLVKLASHTVDMDAIPYNPLVLDVGCRGFDFTNAMLRNRPWASIIAMDASNEVDNDAEDSHVVFVPEALVGGNDQTALFAHHSTGEGDFVCHEVPWYAKRQAVLCTNITALMARYGIKHWDVVKLDCEGSEFGILEGWPGQIADQISVEFHDHTGPWEQYVSGDYYDLLFSGPLKDYEVVRHELSTQGTGCGHWDSLFRRKV